MYILRDEKLFQLTTDHTLLTELQAMDVDKQLEPKQIKRFGHVLTRSVGADAEVAVETLIFEGRKLDVLLLYSDGLSNYFEDDGIVAEMMSGKQVNEIADGLVSFANQCGGKDNITAVVIRITDVDDICLDAHRMKLQYDCTDTATDMGN